MRLDFIWGYYDLTLMWHGLLVDNWRSYSIDDFFDLGLNG